VSGPEFLRYGGDTTSVEIQTGRNDIILIDAGSGIRRLGNRLVRESTGNLSMILTHSHWDHIMGFPFFKPIYLEKTGISFHGCPVAQDSLRKMISRIMRAPNFPVDFSEIKARIDFDENCDRPFAIGPVAVFPIPISHPNGGLGFRFEEDGKKFVFLTDNELSHGHPGGRSFEEYVEFSRGADLLIHDAEFTDGEYVKTRAWGHSTYRDALRLALAAGVRRLGLFHHNQDRSDDALEDILRDCGRIIGEHGASMECFALTQTLETAL
jgi:ribonuclease BN (tRNA processing enzyme)